jgi:hypothetical protein
LVAFGVLLFASSTHPPPHTLYPLLQLNVHPLFTHAGCACVTVVAQAAPHIPQSFALFVGSTQVPLHNVGVAAGHPETHA